MDNIAINTFSAGLQQDYAKTLQQKESYFEALNFRINTESGQSTGILSNVLGNELAIAFPNTGNIVKVEYTRPGAFTGTATITINGIGGSLTFNTNSSEVSQISVFLLTSPLFTSLNLSVYDFGNYIYIYSTSNLTLSITISNTDFSVTTVITPQTNLVPIGSTNIRDEIFILTTSADNVSPSTSDNVGNPNSGTSSNIGQIWKLTYDATKIDRLPLPANIFTLTLLYNNKLNFSLEHPVAPTAIKGNYENDTTKKIYWCDFYNRRKTFNTADPDGFFIPPSIMNSTADLNESVVIMQKIDGSIGGVLPAGMYQYTYRLLNTQGITTQFAPLSNILHIVVDSETSTTVRNYIKETYNFVVTSKAVVLQITGVDTNYDRIQIAYVRRRKLSTLPDVVAIISEEPIDKTSGIATYIHTGKETDIPVTIEELINPIRPIDINKSMAIKDSLLLIANVKSSKLDLNWDARAFRWPLNNNDAPGTGVMTWCSPTPNENVNDINPNQEPTDYNNYLYKQNSNILGGSGTNVAYEFVHDENLTILDGNANPNPGPPYRSVGYENTSFNFGIPNQTYNSYFFPDSLSPYKEAIVRGYQRDETYRFGIVFYDKKGFPGFVKWIADIRMPSIYMPDTTSGDSGQRTSQFPLIKKWFTQEYNGIPIGIKFTVNTTGLEDQISGFSIVRVKRTQGDKTILANGIIQPALDSMVGGSSYIALKNGSPTNPVIGSYDRQYATIFSPETFFGTFGQLSGNSSDHVEIVEVLDVVTGAQAAYENASTSITNSTVEKFYINNTPPILTGTYRATSGAGAGGIGKKFQVAWTQFTPQISTSSNFITDPANSNRLINTSPGQGYLSQGGDTYIIRFALGASGFNNWSDSNQVANCYMNTDGVAGAIKKYLINYKRLVANQYGGNTNTDKSNNNYILCNHYQPIVAGQSIYTSQVYGGDVWVNIFDQNDERKALISIEANTGIKTVIENGGTKNDAILVPKLFVCESAININARSKSDGSNGFGQTHPTVNSSFYANGTNTSFTGLDESEDNLYNPMFSNENDIQTFVPKPIPFIEQDVWDNRIYASGVKINGELSDSWDTFAQGDYKDVDGTYGPINAVLTFNNQLYFLQDRAIGILPVYPRAVLSDAGTANSQLQIGIGNKLDKHQYISTATGTKHQWSVLDTPNAIYYYDVLSKKQYSFNSSRATPLSEVKGMHTFFDRQLTDNFLANDNPVLRKGMSTVYDFKNNEVISTFHDYRIVNSNPVYNEFTIAYNELTDSFTSLYSFHPTIYITNRQIYLSPDPNALNQLYVHSKGNYGSFYGAIYPSELTTIVNENPLITKVFDNQVFETEAINNLNPSQPININNSVWNQVRMYNDYQNTDYQTLITDVTVKRRERSVNIAIPRNRVEYTASNSPNIFTDLTLGNKLFGERLRDKYLTCNYSYDNTSNLLFKVHNIATKYRISPR